jgi:uncharacterized protein DUF4384
MRSTLSRLARSFFGLALVSASACATAGGPNTSAQRSTSRRAETLRYWRELQDSITAQAIADEQGPRVSIRAEFTSYATSRRVEAYFNIQDDAYVFIGHIDANGVVKVLFPEKPDDDGFVRGGKSYHTPPVFAGFEDEYLWRRAHYYREIATSRARFDSYDYGTGYMFIIASWRPMRFDRIAQDEKWSTFELSDYQLLDDPRPAVEELAAPLAGDNREAYTVEWAKYYRTNLGQSGYAASSFSSADCLFQSSSYLDMYPWLYGAYIPVYGYHPFGYAYGSYSSPFGGFGCGARGGYGYIGAYAYGNPFPQQAPPITTPLQRPLPNYPLTLPRWGRPSAQLPEGTPRPGDAPAGVIQAAPRLRATDEALTPRGAQPANGYRQRGLLTDDDGSAMRPTPPRVSGESDRPSIVDMVGRRRAEIGDVNGGSQNGRTERYGQPRNARESVEVPRGTRPPHNDGSSYPGAGVSPSRGSERQFNPSYDQPRERPTSHPSSGGGTETRAAPAPSPSPRIEAPSHPTPSPRVEPASRPEPAAKPNPKG